MDNIETLIRNAKSPQTRGQVSPVTFHVNDLNGQIAAAWREFREGRIQPWYRCSRSGVTAIGVDRKYAERNGGMICCGWTPHGFWVSIAELCLDVARLMADNGWEFQPLPPEDWNDAILHVQDLPAFVAGLYVCVMGLGIDACCLVGRDWCENPGKTTSGVLQLCLYVAKHSEVDLWPVLSEVLAYRQWNGW